MMKKILLTLTMIGLLWISTAISLLVNCPIDNANSYFTGTTKTVDGKLLELWKCPTNHYFWVVR